MSYLELFYTLVIQLKCEYILLSIILVTYSVYLWMKGEKNLPPGPTGLPIVGYLPFLGTEAYHTLHNLTKKYGPLYSLYLGRKLVVVLGNFEVVKEALSNNNILDRPKNPPNHLLPNSTNMSVSNGNTWKEQRYFSIQALRKLGMAKQEMEEQIRTEIQKLVAEIDKKNGQCINLDAVLYSSVSNNILKLLIGHSLEYDNEHRIFLNEMLKTMTMFFRPTRIHAYFPWLRFWMVKWKIWGYDKADYFMTRLGRFIEKQIEDHKTTKDHLIARDYIDAYLQSMITNKSENSSFSEKMLKGNFQSLFSAGSTPSRAALEWTILSTILYPEVQRKVCDELDAVIGRERLPTWSDYLNLLQLIFTMAVIYEAMRQNSIVPISMLRCTATKVKLAGYDLPKDTIIMTNIWGVHHDPKSWADPFTFKPERFIHDGKTFKPQEFIPFSYGKRNCFGEDMALMTVFLYFASLMQRYTISFPENNKEVQLVLGVARLVVLDNVLLTIRK